MACLPNEEEMQSFLRFAEHDCRVPCVYKWSLLFRILKRRCAPGFRIAPIPWTSRCKQQPTVHFEQQRANESCLRSRDHQPDQYSGFPCANITRAEWWGVFEMVPQRRSQPRHPLERLRARPDSRDRPSAGRRRSTHNPCVAEDLQRGAVRSDPSRPQRGLFRGLNCDLAHRMCLISYETKRDCRYVRHSQKTYFSANCRIRGSSAFLNTPKVLGLLSWRKFPDPDGP